MAGLLQLSNYEFKTTMINVQRVLVGKVDKMKEQMGNINKDGNSRNQKEMLENIMLEK